MHTTSPQPLHAFYASLLELACFFNVKDLHASKVSPRTR